MSTMESGKPKSRLSVRIGTSPYTPAPKPGETVVGELEYDVPVEPLEDGNESTGDQLPASSARSKRP